MCGPISRGCLRCVPSSPCCLICCYDCLLSLQDPLSAQNGTIVTLATKACLLIDPQSQGTNWIVAREADNGLANVSESSPGLCAELEDCLEAGRPMLVTEVLTDT